MTKIFNIKDKKLFLKYQLLKKFKISKYKNLNIKLIEIVINQEIFFSDKII